MTAGQTGMEVWGDLVALLVFKPLVAFFCQTFCPAITVVVATLYAYFSILIHF
jgi:uncharacterized membrane protein